jgi:hypothetical protein
MVATRKVWCHCDLMEIEAMSHNIADYDSRTERLHFLKHECRINCLSSWKRTRDQCRKCLKWDQEQKRLRTRRARA